MFKLRYVHVLDLILLPTVDYGTVQTCIFSKCIQYAHVHCSTNITLRCTQFSSVQSLSCVQLFVTLWTVARRPSLSITNSPSLLKFISINLVMLSNHVILCHPFLLLPSVFPSIRVFSNESILHIRWPKYWNFSFSISPSNEFQG